jgi:HEAT repeat protein
VTALGPHALQAAHDPRVAELQRALAQGELDVIALIERLDEPSWTLRRAMVSALAGMGDEAAASMIEALTSRRDDEARIAALVDALASSTGRVESLLQPLVDHEDPAIVADVAQVLGRRRASSSRDILIGLTRHQDDNVAVAAIEGLGRIGGQSAVSALVACVEGNNFFRTFPAIDVLGRSGDPRAVAPLANLLRNPRYAFEAARALGRTADRAAVAPLLALLSAPSEASLRVACRALSELCDRHAELYGVATGIEVQLRAGRTDSLVRRIGQSLASADKPEKIAMCRVLSALGGGDAARFMLPLLDGEPEVASAAGRALQQLGKDSNDTIAQALHEPHSARRAVLLPGVTRLDQAEAALACLEDRDPNVRALAAEALARIGYTAAARALFVRLADESPRVAHAASSAIQALGSNETEPLALEAAHSPLREVRRAALRILAYFGYVSALPLFEAALADHAGDARMRDAAVQGLTLLELDAARALLLRTTQSEDAKLRAAAMRALGQVPAAPDTLQRLHAGLSDDDAWVRYYACQALGRLADATAVEALKGLLRDDAGQVRVAAVEALSHLPGEAARSALRASTRTDDPDMQRAALLGLGLTRDDASLPIFLEALRHGDASTRLIALSALASVTGPAVTEALTQAARDEDESVRTAAIGFLQATHDQASSAALIELVRDDTERKRALDALATRPVSADVRALRAAALLQGLAQADDALAPLLASCLAKLGGQVASASLLHAITLPHKPARLAAANALSALATREAYEALSSAAVGDIDEDVRRVCALHVAG